MEMASYDYFLRINISNNMIYKLLMAFHESGEDFSEMILPFKTDIQRNFYLDRGAVRMRSIQIQEILTRFAQPDRLCNDTRLMGFGRQRKNVRFFWGLFFIEFNLD